VVSLEKLTRSGWRTNTVICRVVAHFVALSRCCCDRIVLLQLSTKVWREGGLQNIAKL
jgi:hypothetical protein